MSAQFATAGANANSGTDTRVGKSTGIDGTFDKLRKKFRALWPVKTAEQVAARSHISVRSAERFLARENELSTEAIIHLLRSDEGLRFLVILMDRARPKWWANLLRMGMLGGIERRREADLRLVQSIANADRSLPAQLQAATILQDEDFYGPFLEGLAAMSAGGADGGTLASSAAAALTPRRGQGRVR